MAGHMGSENRIGGILKGISGGNIEEVAKSILSKSISAEMWVLHFAVLLFGLLIGAIVILAAAVIIISVAILSMFNLVLIIAAGLLLLLLGGAMLLFSYSALEGIKINAVNDFILKGKFSFSDAWGKTKKRLATIIALNLLLLVIFSAAMALFIGLFIIALLPMLASPLMALLTIILFFVVFIALLFAIIIAELLLSPFFIILMPVVVLEKSSLMAAIRRAIQLGKRNYIYNLIFIILLMVFSFIINLVFQLIIFLPSIMLSFIPIAGALIIFIISLPLVIYISILNSLLSVRLYQEDAKRAAGKLPNK